MSRRAFLSTAAAASFAIPASVAAMQKQMKITGLETDLLKTPPREPNYDAIHKLGVDTGAVVLRIKTDAGLTGWASSPFRMIAGSPPVVQTVPAH